MQVFNRQVSARGVAVFGIETALIPASILAAVRLRESGATSSANLWEIVLITALCELCFYYNDLYDLTIVQSTREIVIRVLQAAGATSIVLAAAYVATPSFDLSASTVIIALGVVVISVVMWRVAFASVAQDARLEERLLILGTGVTAHALARQIATQQDFAYRLIGFIDDGNGKRMVRNDDVLGTIVDDERLVATQRIDRL